MTIIEDISSLSEKEIEAIEKLTMRWLFQATLDFGLEAVEIFRQSPDKVKDIAEDITREILDRLPGYNVPQRIYGTVDYKKARYIILPDQMIRQALFVDSKAEKDKRSATLQMSQISMRVKHIRDGKSVDQEGALPQIATYSDKQYLTTTAFLHFHYRDQGSIHHLNSVTLLLVPNGKLQDKYNPDVSKTFWLAGRNAPTRGEDFRVRVSFDALRKMAAWRIQQIGYDTNREQCHAEWSE